MQGLSVLSKIEAGFVYELAGSYFVVSVPAPGGKHTLRFHMSAYEPVEIRKFYGEYSRKVRRLGNDEVLHVGPNPKPIIDFVDTHLLKIDGLALAGGGEITDEVKKAWLDTQPSLKEAVFDAAYDRFPITSETEEEDLDTEDFLISPISQTYTVETGYTLYSCEEKRDISLPLNHTFGKFSESDRIHYTQAFHSIEHTRKQEIRVESELHTIEALYDARAKALSGARIRGDECTEANTECWIPKVPLLMKIVAISRAMKQVSLKN